MEKERKRNGDGLCRGRGKEINKENKPVKERELKKRETEDT